MLCVRYVGLKVDLLRATPGQVLRTMQRARRVPPATRRPKEGHRIPPCTSESPSSCCFSLGDSAAFSTGRSSRLQASSWLIDISVPSGDTASRRRMTKTLPPTARSAIAQLKSPVTVPARARTTKRTWSADTPTRMTITAAVTTEPPRTRRPSPSRRVNRAAVGEARARLIGTTWTRMRMVPTETSLPSLPSLLAVAVPRNVYLLLNSPPQLNFARGGMQARKWQVECSSRRTLESTCFTAIQEKRKIATTQRLEGRETNTPRRHCRRKSRKSSKTANVNEHQAVVPLSL
jgi:hypothetical protein